MHNLTVCVMTIVADGTFHFCENLDLIPDGNSSTKKRFSITN